jgi:hypothetical protein
VGAVSITTTSCSDLSTVWAKALNMAISCVHGDLHGASYLGKLAGLESKKDVYKHAVKTLADKNMTTLVMVSRPEIGSLREAERASREFQDLGINNQILILNGVLNSFDDTLSQNIFHKNLEPLCDISNIHHYNRSHSRPS